MANVNLYIEDFVSSPLKTKRVTLKPTGSNVSVSGSSIVVTDEISKYTNIKESNMVKVIDVPEIKNFVTGEIIQAEVSHLEEANPFSAAVDI
jgi:hypothetical protein